MHIKLDNTLDEFFASENLFLGFFVCLFLNLFISG